MKKSLAKRLYSKLARVAIAKLPESTYKEALMKRYVNVISNIVVIVGQNCTLKCQDCANFSPYLSKILPFYPAQEIIADMQELIKEAQIAYLQFQGGEFFYHPDAREILAFAVQSPRIHSICIATNATIIPKDSMLELLASPKVIVRISNYGQVNAKTATKLEEVLQARGIAVILRNTYRGAGLWSKCGDKDTKRLPPKAMQKVFDSCTFAKECLTMENGFITRCSRGTIAHIMQGFRLGGGDGVLVRPQASRSFETIHLEANEANADKRRQTGGGGESLPIFTYKSLQRFITDHQPITACYYCYGSEGVQVTPGVQMSKEQLEAIKQTQLPQLSQLSQLQWSKGDKINAPRA